MAFAGFDFRVLGALSDLFLKLVIDFCSVEQRSPSMETVDDRLSREVASSEIQLENLYLIISKASERENFPICNLLFVVVSFISILQVLSHFQIIHE